MAVYRIIYTFDAERSVIHLLAVDNRREIYRDSYYVDTASSNQPVRFYRAVPQ